MEAVFFITRGQLKVKRQGDKNHNAFKGFKLMPVFVSISCLTVLDFLQEMRQ